MTRTNAARRRALGLSPAALLTSLLAAAAIFPPRAASAETREACSVLKPGKLKKLARDSHVLLKVDRRHPAGDAEDSYRDLCNRYKGSPKENVRDLIIGHFAIDLDSDDEEKRKPREVAKKFGADDPDEWPTYVLLKKGTTEASDAVKFEGEETEEGLANFLREEVGVKVGTLLYYLAPLDRMASRFVGVDEHGGARAQLERKFYAYAAKVMIFLFRGEAKGVAQMYGKVFSSILKEGNDYATKTKERLDGLLKDSEKTMSSSKKEEVAQRVHILEKFTDPVEVTAEENRSFFFAAAWNILLLVSVVVMIIMMLLEGKGDGKDSVEEGKTVDDTDDEGKEDGDEDKKDESEEADTTKKEQ